MTKVIANTKTEIKIRKKVENCPSGKKVVINRDKTISFMKMETVSELKLDRHQKISNVFVIS